MKLILTILLLIVLFVIILFMYSSLVLAKKSDSYIENKRDNY